MTKVEQSTSDQLLHTHHIFRAHQELLEDAVRNRGFYHALRKHISAESTVLDIGAGTGLWAICRGKARCKKGRGDRKGRAASGSYEKSGEGEFYMLLARQL